MIFLLFALTAAADPAPLVEGDYRMIVDVASRSELALAGTTHAVTRSLLRVRVARGPEGLMQEQQVCAVRMIADTKASTEVPDAFIASLPRQRYPIELDRDSAGVWRYSVDPGVSEVGFDPAESGGVLPTGRNDPGVIDSDGDGNPGVTVRFSHPWIGTVRIYLVQRGHSRYSGVVRDGTVRGEVEIVTMEQSTLGASFAPFAANPTITPVAKDSRFVLQPVEGPQSCADLRAAWDGELG